MLPPCSCRWYKHIPPFPTLCCFSSTDLLFQIRHCFPAYSYTLAFPEWFSYWKSFVYPLVGIWIIAPADPSCRSTEGWSPLGTAWNYCTANLRGAPSKDQCPIPVFLFPQWDEVLHFGKNNGDYVCWDFVMVEGQISFSLEFIDKYLALISKCSCINRAESK